MKIKYILLFILFPALGFNQHIEVTGTNANGMSDALANDYLVPNPVDGPTIWDQDNCILPNFAAGLFGNDFGTVCFLHAKQDGLVPQPHEVSSYIGARAFINGDNTNTVHIKWKNTGTNYARTDGHNAVISTTMNFTVTMEVSGLPPATSVEVHWWYDIFGGGSTSHEDPLLEEDSIFVTNTMTVNGAQQFTNNQFNFSSPNGLPGWNEWKNVTGTFKVDAGDPFQFAVTSDIELYLNEPPAPGGFGFGVDQNDGIFKGDIYFTITPQYPVPVDNTEDMLLSLFSLDIGSDTELSDPKGDGNEYFDPGDMYPKYQGVPLPVVTPWSDDSLIFGHDPNPVPYPPVFPAPVGSGQPPIGLQPIFFDLDGSDLTQFSIQALTYGPGDPSIPWFSDSCVFEAAYLFVSYDDDNPEHYASSVPSVPATSPSPVMGSIYSESGTQDEMVGAVYDPYPVTGQYYNDSVFSEGLLHTNLLPDPIFTNDQDDDVDALDMIPVNGNYTPCSEWYVSVDHEAAYNHPSIPSPFLDPGAIYEVIGGVPVDVINSTHHGLSAGTDIDAFEFAWVWDFNEGRFGLALLFSVDDDDPLTADDESGGLSPQRIYYSFLNGTHHQFSSNLLPDDVDALTNWHHSLNGTQAFQNPVWGNKTWTGSQSADWSNALNWFPQGVPFDPEVVTVPGITPMPVISAGGLECKALNILNGASVTIQGGNTFSIKGP